MTALLSPTGSRHPLVLTGLKAYFSHAETKAWFGSLTRIIQSGAGEGLEFAVLPSATALATLAPEARAYGITLGTQDCSVAPDFGAHTGELPAQLLAELGAQLIIVGHVERRKIYGDDDATIALKVKNTVQAGMFPMACVGEDERVEPARAAELVLGQLDRWLARVPATTPAVVAYEPSWAIGQAEPADAAHINAVCQILGPGLRAARPGSRLLYGGTAGPGLYPQIAQNVDGLALGRKVHNPVALAAVVEEMRTHAQQEKQKENN